MFFVVKKSKLIFCAVIFLGICAAFIVLISKSHSFLERRDFECHTDSDLDVFSLSGADIEKIIAVNAEVNSEESMEAEGQEQQGEQQDKTEEKKYIKWVEFNVPYSILEKALKYDIESHKNEESVSLDWVELISYTAYKNWGKFEKKSAKIMDDLVKRLKNGEKFEDQIKDENQYNFYKERYSSILSEFVGEYQIEEVDPSDSTQKVFVKKYGLKAFSPIAKGYGFSHYDDFGMARSYGYKRKHLGNDIMARIGTPIIAIEGGIVEAAGWNQYGGWRVGVRSFDKKRYYYYAHLRKDFPFNSNITEGTEVKAGDVIGYLGMTGYSTKENKNNINTPHLHLGLQLIFDESQKEGTNQIWIDMYNIVELLQKNKSQVYKDAETKEYHRFFDIRTSFE